MTAQNTQLGSFSTKREQKELHPKSVTSRSSTLEG